MLSTRRHDHQVSSFDILVFTSNGSFTYTRCEGQSLVDGVNLRENGKSVSLYLSPEAATNIGEAKTDLIADIPADRHGHEHDLRV